MHKALRFPGRQRRAFSAVVDTLKHKIQGLAEKKAPQLTALRKEHGGKVLGETTVGQCIGGMRGITCMISETSLLERASRGMSSEICVKHCDGSAAQHQDCMDQLPKAPGSKIGLPEASFWLLLTDEIPSDAEVKALNEELHKRSALPESVLRFQTREQASDFQLALEFFGRWDEEPRSTGMVLDLGCGDALMARRFVQSKHFQTVFAVDILWAPLAAARAAAEAENTFKDGLLMLRGDAQSLPFREKQLDFVWWGLGIHKVQDAEKALRNIKEVLKPGGRMIATTRTFLYPPFELRLMAKTAGLENISVECVGEGTSAERLLLRAAAPRA
eukprot:g7988.t1